MKRRATTHGSPTTPGRIFRTWLAQHAQAFFFSLGQISKNPIGSFLTIAVIGVSLSLPAGFYLLLDNASRITSDWSGVMQITLFLEHDLTEKEVVSLADGLTGHESIENIKIISRDMALEEYQQYSGFTDALAALDVNPLPPVLLLQLKQEALIPDKSEQLFSDLQSIEGVETAQFDRQWARRLTTIIEIFQRAVIILSTLLAFAVLLIIGNTIRLAIYNRREEIEINQLFGATNAFIQRPFLYSGFIHGVCGSVMAWVLLIASTRLLEVPLMRLSGLYANRFELISLSLTEVLILVASGGMLGLAGSWLAVQRNFKAIGLN